MRRPWTILSAAVSLDGYLGGPGPDRLVLSGDADLDRVDEVRASCDAILVGARTLRLDDPRLLVRSEARRTARVASGLPPTPTRVVVVGDGPVDPAAALLTTGPPDRLLYGPADRGEELRALVGDRATVVGLPRPLDLARVLDDLAGRCVDRLLVEGGSSIHTQLLTAELADELHLAIAPIFVGDPAGVRFVGAGMYPWHAGRRARLVEHRRLDDCVLLRYALTDRDERIDG